MEVDIEEDMAATTSASTVVGCFAEMRWCSIYIIEFCERGRWGQGCREQGEQKTTKTNTG